MTTLTGFAGWLRTKRAERRSKAEALLVELRHMHQIQTATDQSIARLRRMKSEGMEQEGRFEAALVGLSVDLVEECEEICWEYHKAMREGGM